MGQPGDGLRFAPEALENGLRRDQVRRQHLDREMALEAQVADEIDDGEPAGAERLLDHIAITERRLEALGELVDVGLFRGCDHGSTKRNAGPAAIATGPALLTRGG